MTTADFGYLARRGDQPACQPPEYLKSPSYPEMAGRSDREPPICHGDLGGCGQVGYLVHGSHSRRDPALCFECEVSSNSEFRIRDGTILMT